MTLKNATILVTGGNGFLGARVAEVLALRYGAHVRALVRDVRRSVRICRLPIEMVVGDVRDERAVQRAVDGCSIVVHCASAIDARAPRACSTFVGTEIVARAAQQRNVKRLVHISSASVYGSPGDVQVNEEFRREPRWKGDIYGAAKIAGEEIIEKYHSQGLATATIQPTIIYGPYSGEWTVSPLGVLRRGDYMVPTSGRCNPVYVDDVVRAIILAATKDGAVGKRYIVSGCEAPSWREFYEHYVKMGTDGQIVTANDVEYWSGAGREHDKSLVEVVRAVLGLPEVRNVMKESRIFRGSYDLARRMLPEKAFARVKGKLVKRESRADHGPAHVKRPIIRPVPALWDLCRSESRYGIDKAAREIDFQPKISLERGMQLTGQWAKWARLI